MGLGSRSSAGSTRRLGRIGLGISAVNFIENDETFRYIYKITSSYTFKNKLEWHNLKTQLFRTLCVISP